MKCSFSEDCGWVCENQRSESLRLCALVRGWVNKRRNNLAQSLPQQRKDAGRWRYFILRAIWWATLALLFIAVWIYVAIQDG
jgi:hypothetical protein